MIKKDSNCLIYMVKELDPQGTTQQIRNVGSVDGKVDKRRSRLKEEPVLLPSNQTICLTEKQKIILVKLVDAWRLGEDCVAKTELIEALIGLHPNQLLTPKKAEAMLYSNVLKLREKFVAVNADCHIESTTTPSMRQRKESGGYAFRQSPTRNNNRQAIQEKAIFQGEPHIMPVKTPDQEKPDPFDSNFFRRQRSFAIRTKDLQEKGYAPKIKTPEQILAFSSTLKVLSNLLDGKLSQLNPKIEVFLENVMQNNRHFKGFNNLTLETIFNTTSINRLKRFFRVTFITLVEQGYNPDPKDAKQEDLEEERLIREECQQLKNRSCDTKPVIQQVLPYFDIEIPQEYL